MGQTQAAERSETPSGIAALQRGGRARDLIDVRQPAEFASVHAAGSRLVPLDHLDPAAVMADRLAPAEPLYLICKSGTRSSQARQRFAAAGFHDTVVVVGGTDAWLASGAPVVRGRASPPASMERQVRIAAGLLVVAGVVLGRFVDRRLVALSGLVGAGLVYAGVSDTCAMAKVLEKMPWNRPG